MLRIVQESVEWTLYDLPLSPFCARVRAQIRLKNLPVAIEAPPESLCTDAFYQRFPLGKIPVLSGPEGELAESVAIMEFLEDCYPEPSLRPDDAMARAHMRMLCRYTDLQFGPSFGAAFFYLLVPNGEAPSLQASLECLAVLEQVVPDTVRSLPELHDLSLGTTFYFLTEVCERLGVDAGLENYPRISAWWRWLNTNDVFRATATELGEALQQRLEMNHAS